MLGVIVAVLLSAGVLSCGGKSASTTGDITVTSSVSARPQSSGNHQWCGH